MQRFFADFIKFTLVFTRHYTKKAVEYASSFRKSLQTDCPDGTEEQGENQNCNRPAGVGTSDRCLR